jgi:hypothetical protein
MTKKTIDQDTFKDISFKVFNDSVPLRGNKNKAQLLGVKLNENGQITCDIIRENSDIYELLSKTQANEIMMSKLGQYDLISVSTGGWAAPVNNDEGDEIAPSQHPQRKRVLVSIMGYTVNQVSSVISFDGEDEEQVYDYNKGQGALREAFDELLTGLNWV